MFFTRAKAESLNFDDEARALWARLNLEGEAGGNGRWNPIDPIWKHPAGGTIYVGNQMAAENLQLLKSLGITHIVNCTSGYGKIPDYHEGTLAYYNFAISNWSVLVDSRDESVLQFTQPMFEFVESAVSNSSNVLIHCLAGAHRAGTTGVACLIHFAKLDVASATKAAKTCRPIIDPIGRFPDFLCRLDAAKSSERAAAAPKQRR